MAGRIETPSHPVTGGGADVRLRWWAVLLPTLAFVMLLLLVLNPGEAHAATGTPAVARLVALIREAAAG